MIKKSIPVILTLAMALAAGAQVPQKFNYQAVVRDAQHAVIASQEVGFRLSILEGSPEGAPRYIETHEVMTSPVGLADLEVGGGAVVQGDFSAIPWGGQACFLKVEVDPSGGTDYALVGTSQLVSVPYSLYTANVSSPTRKFVVQEESGHPADSALFEVRNRDGQTVFAVYPEGTRVYVLDDDSKATRRGFAVGGYSRGATKGITQEYMFVSPDSVRIYVENEDSKATRGGFAVGGYSRTKATAGEFFRLTPDSARFTLVSPTDDISSNALTVVTRTKSGQELGTKGTNLFNLTQNNYAIGHRAGESLAEGGDGNVFLGFESGVHTTTGFGNIFIGRESGIMNTTGSFNTGIGYKAGKSNLEGINNIHIGFAAGEEAVNGSHNVYIGADAGHESQGVANVFLGTSAGWNARSGSGNVIIGTNAGINADTINHNVFIGLGSGANQSGGSSNVFVGAGTGEENKGFDNIFLGAEAGYGNQTGSNNIFIGTSAGRNNQAGNDNIFIGQGTGMDETGSGKLFIDLGNRPSDQALIYGEFYDSRVRINNKLGIGRLPDQNALEVEGDVSKSVVGDWLANSDVRIKSEIADIENATDIILQLRPVTFHYSEEYLRMHPRVKDRQYYNYVAQEFREVFPGSVQAGGGTLEGDPDPLLQLDSHPAQVVAVKAIQELIEQNREQQRQIELLNEKIRALETSLADR